MRGLHECRVEDFDLFVQCWVLEGLCLEVSVLNWDRGNLFTALDTLAQKKKGREEGKWERQRTEST